MNGQDFIHFNNVHQRIRESGVFYFREGSLDIDNEISNKKS